MKDKAFARLALALWAAGFAVLLGLIRAQTGLLFYTLDDPYIHLSVAEEILRGGYGINRGVFASPSSSMLYPLLLAPLLALGLGTTAPLILAAAGQAAAVALLARAAAPHLARHGRLVAVLGAALLVLAINGYALPFTGMEHPIHVAASVAVVLGLWRAASGAVPGPGNGRAAEPVPVWLVPAILLAAAIRFEGFALALGAIAALAALRQYRTALTGLALLCAMTAAYALAMRAMGLPLLPSSVMVKSQASAAALDAGLTDMLDAVIANAARALSHRWGVLFCLFALAFAGAALHPHASRPVRAVSALALVVLGAHLLAGRYGWFGRYEVYATATALAAVFIVAPRSRATALALLPVLALIGWTYVPITAHTPAAALSIHQQQHQMHRLATAYFTDPVAVNDLGYVAYDNDGFVLDLWGLGSEEARRLTRAEGRSADTLRVLTGERVTWAMIYDIAFADAIPPEWCRIGTLTTSRVIAASDTVSIYLIDPRREEALRAALTAFAPGLPGGATLTLTDCED